jgi:predicted nucleotidyltransferase
MATLTAAARRCEEQGAYSWAPTVDDAREVAAALAAADSRVRQVVLFGSVAAGTARRSSDLDLAVVADCDPDGVPGLLASLYPVAEGAAGRMVDLVVRTCAQWDHLVANVSSSLESRVAADGVGLYDSPTAGAAASDRFDGVPADDIDVAADEADSVCDQMEGLWIVLTGIAAHEAVLASDPSINREARRDGRYRQMLQTAHMAVERSIAAVAAAVDGRGHTAGHDLDKALAELGESPTRDAMLAAVQPARGPDGNLMNWRRAAYTGRIPDFAPDTNPGRTANWVTAAVGCAQTATAAVADRATTDRQKRSAAAAAAAARRVADMGIDAAAVEHGTGIGPAASGDSP